jgi:DNA invertase Pin-like site-specific DNA recombinase
MAFDAFGEGRTRRPVRCVIYTRQSVGSSDELSSCATQREACAVFAASQGWIVENFRFDDVGFSGATLDRPGLQRILAFLREDGADHILVHRLDRLSRRVADCVKLFDEFRRLHVNLVIVTVPELGNAAQDHFLLNIMASFAEFEREMIAGRIAEARARLKWERKRLAGAVPYGYNANPRTKQFEPAPAEAEVVRWMFAEAAAGKRPSEIAGEANTNQHRTKANGPWSARQVVATLRNPVYAGYLGNGEGIRLGEHPPVIDMDQFEAAGRALDSRRTARPKPSAYGDVWPLKGKIRCGQCGRPLSPHSCRRGNKVYRYYRCRATAGGRAPCGYLIPALDIESMIWKRQPNVREGESLDAGRLRQLVARVVYKPDQNRVAVTWKKDPE